MRALRTPRIQPDQGSLLMYSRRDFGKFAVAGLPLSMSMGVALGAKTNSVVSGVHLGNSTSSSPALPPAAGGDPADAVIAALITDGAGEIELFAPTIEPAGPPRP